ncbi:MAG: carboxylase [Deltaproteobacteria bacterium]|nr:MAG: carboxylase [Deltaproteobacteria bacterium]
MSKKKKNPLKITDLTFRDGHQSLFATRMRTEDIEAIAETAGKVGYHSMEVWGGATFDTMHRFLGEDPWERPRTLRKYIPEEVKFQMLLRGQNAVGYRNYADDVVEAFVDEACDVGINIFRIFDALNDPRNFETAAKAVLKNKQHFQAALSFTLTERRMGGNIFTLEYWLGKAKTFAEMGAHSICIKDMAGLLSPDDAYTLIKGLKDTVDIPIELHCHTTSGLAEYTFLKAIEAGVDILDTCSAPFANRTSHPAIEPIVAQLQGTSRDTGLDFDKLNEINEYLEGIAPKYRHLLDTTRLAVVDIGVLRHQVPGGMLSNLVNQLRQANATDKLGAVFKELPRVRKDLGFPPLVTPTSQIVGVQAVQNVLFGNPDGSLEERYKMISGQVKDYCYGLYGTPPAEVNEDLRTLALKGYPRGEEPITCRPADILEPELEAAKAEIGDLAKDRKDLILYTLFPTTGKRFLRVREGLEDAPAEWTPRTIEEAQAEEALVAKAKAGELVEKGSAAAPSSSARSYQIFVDGEAIEVTIDGALPCAAPGATIASPAPSAPAPVAAASQPAVVTAPSPAAPAPSAPSGAGVLTSPMPGLVIDYKVKAGDKVSAGDVVVVLEAMKMENNLEAPISGTVKEIVSAQGSTVETGAVLLVIE